MTSAGRLVARLELGLGLFTSIPMHLPCLAVLPTLV